MFDAFAFLHFTAWYQMNKKSKSAEERTEGEVESAQKHAAKDDVRVQQTAV